MPDEVFHGGFGPRGEAHVEQCKLGAGSAVQVAHAAGDGGLDVAGPGDLHATGALGVSRAQQDGAADLGASLHALSQLGKDDRGLTAGEALAWLAGVGGSVENPAHGRGRQRTGDGSHPRYAGRPSLEAAPAGPAGPHGDQQRQKTRNTPNRIPPFQTAMPVATPCVGLDGHRQAGRGDGGGQSVDRPRQPDCHGDGKQVRRG